MGVQGQLLLGRQSDGVREEQGLLFHPIVGVEVGNFLKVDAFHGGVLVHQDQLLVFDADNEGVLELSEDLEIGC